MLRQLPLFKAIACVVDPGGDQRLTQRASTVNFHFCMKRCVVDPVIWVNMLSLCCWSWGGDQQLTQRASTANFHFCMKRWSLLLILRGAGRGGFMINTEDGQSTVNCHFHMKRWLPLLILGDRPTIDTERINSQLLLSREKAITSVDPEGGVGGGDRCPRDILCVARVDHQYYLKFDSLRKDRVLGEVTAVR